MLRKPFIALALLLAPALLFHPAALAQQPSLPQNPPPESQQDPALKLPPTEEIADTLAVRGRYLAAIHVYEALPQTAQISNKLGIACEHMRMFDRARLAFQAAIKQNPRYAEAYNNLGTLAHSVGDTRTAEKMYKKSLSIKPDSASTLVNLGTLLYTERKYKKGDQAYRKALAIDPEALSHRNDRAIAANTDGRSVSELHYHMAMTYAQAGSRQLALQMLRQAINEGFADRNRMLHEKDFAALRTTDVFLKMADDLKKD